MDTNVIKILHDYVTLNEKIEHLKNAVTDDSIKVSIMDANLIMQQLKFMEGYRDCLYQRIKINGFVDKI